MTDGYIDAMGEGFARDMDETISKVTAADERHGVPSASYMRRIANCPPSFKLGKLFPDPRTNDSDTGDRIHKALELGNSDGLAVDELQTYEMCVDQKNWLLEEWIGDEMGYTAHKETRLVMSPLGKVFDDSPDLRITRIFSGKADYVAVFGEGALVIDYKTLHGEHDHAAVNDQLRALAVLVAERHKVSQVRVAIVQPWKGKPTVADFDYLTLKASKAWLLDALDKERESTPDQANAGDWCHYCPARIKCEAFNKPINQIVEYSTRGLGGHTEETMQKAAFARVAELGNEELASLYADMLPKLKWLSSAIEGNVRMRAAEGGEFAEKHFRIVEGKPKESIERVDVAFQNLSALGVTPEDFTAVCKTTKKAVTALARKATGQKGRELEVTVKRCLEGAVKLGKPPQKLVAVGQAIEDDGEDGEE